MWMDTGAMAVKWHIVRHLMNFGIGLLVGTAFLAVAAWAAVPSRAADSVVIISRSDCARLVPHQPAADVAYKPGVDVHGRAVVPADLPGAPQLAMSDEIAIDISVELQSRFNIPANSAFFNPEARVGTVVVKPDGSVTFDGQPLTNPEVQALGALCQKQGAPASR